MGFNGLQRLPKYLGGYVITCSSTTPSRGDLPYLNLPFDMNAALVELAGGRRLGPAQSANVEGCLFAFSSYLAPVWLCYLVAPINLR